MKTNTEDGADGMLRAFFGHHKCGTSWIDSVLVEISLHLGRRFGIVHTPRDFREYGHLDSLVRALKLDVLAYTNATIEEAQRLPAFRGFHVVRDPRDVLVSAYFSHLRTHPTWRWPELADHRRRLESLSEEDGLLCEMEFSAASFEAMLNWNYEQPNVLELRFEDLIADPKRGFDRIFGYLGVLEDGGAALSEFALTSAQLVARNANRGRRKLPSLPLVRLQPKTRGLTRAVLHRIVDSRSFERLSGGRPRGLQDPNSHYRSGLPGNWRTQLSEQHIREFKKKYNQLLLKLGYETHVDW